MSQHVGVKLRALENPAIFEEKDHSVSRLSVVPSHLHAALRVEPDRSPLELVFSYQNNLAYLQQLGRLWDKGFYVGTFGEYSMQAVRNRVSVPSGSPTR